MLLARCARLAACVLVAAAAALIGCAAQTPMPGRPAWAVSVDPGWGDVSAAAVTGDSVVVKASAGVAVLTRDRGALRWFLPWGSAAASPSRVTNNQLYVSADTVLVVTRTGDGVVVRGHRLGTGAVGYSRTYSSVAQAGAAAAGLVVADCSPDGCTVQRLDPITGAVAWQAPLPARAKAIAQNLPTNRGVTHDLDDAVAEPVDPLVLPHRNNVAVVVATDPPEVAVFDAATGAGRGRWSTTDGVIAQTTDDRFLSWNLDRDCPAFLAIADPAAGTKVGAVTVGRWGFVNTSPDGGSVCKDLLHLAATTDRVLAMTPDEIPVLLDPRTGRVSWTGATGHHLYGLAGERVIVRTDHNRGPLTAVDTRTGTTVWTRSLGTSSTVTVTATHVAYTTGALDQIDIHLVEVATGGNPTELGRGRLHGIGNDWAITGTAQRPTVSGRDDKAEIRLYTIT